MYWTLLGARRASAVGATSTVFLFVNDNVAAASPRPRAAQTRGRRMRARGQLGETRARGTMTSREAANVYATREPQDAFARRIGFLLDVHTEAVRGMRYPPGAHREDLETAEQRREREKEEAAFAAAEPVDPREGA